MKLKKDSSEQKLRGAYYTPLKLAEAMVGLFTSEDISSVLEPSCGDGVFLDALDNLGMLQKIKKISAVEIEPGEAEKVQVRYKNNSRVNVYRKDFFDFYNEMQGGEKYDLSLRNPSYIRYQ